jgi:hypothetical protein
LCTYLASRHSRLATQQIHNPECRKDLIHARWNDVEQRHQQPAFEREIHLQSAIAAAGERLVDSLLDVRAPLGELRQRIDLGCLEARVIQNFYGTVSNLGLEHVVERRRRIGGTDGDRNLVRALPLAKRETGRDRRLPDTAFAHRE